MDLYPTFFVSFCARWYDFPRLEFWHLQNYLHLCKEQKVWKCLDKLIFLLQILYFGSYEGALLLLNPLEMESFLSWSSEKFQQICLLGNVVSIKLKHPINPQSCFIVFVDDIATTAFTCAIIGLYPISVTNISFFYVILIFWNWCVVLLLQKGLWLFPSCVGAHCKINLHNIGCHQCSTWKLLYLHWYKQLYNSWFGNAYWEPKKPKKGNLLSSISFSLCLQNDLMAHYLNTSTPYASCCESLIQCSLMQYGFVWASSSVMHHKGMSC